MRSNSSPRDHLEFTTRVPSLKPLRWCRCHCVVCARLASPNHAEMAGIILLGTLHDDRGRKRRGGGKEEKVWMELGNLNLVWVWCVFWCGVV